VTFTFEYYPEIQEGPRAWRGMCWCKISSSKCSDSQVTVLTEKTRDGNNIVLASATK